MSDILFSTVEKWSGESNRKWGRFLDAGTGTHSLKWIETLDTDGWTAITADENMRQQILSSGVKVRPDTDAVLVGNWMSTEFCGLLGKFDTILADYLFGAVDGFSPYTQDIIVDKLRAHLNPGGRLYIVGMNPIPDHAPGAGEIVTEVRRARDAAILLAGHRPYREFPLEWMVRHLKKSQFNILHSKSYTILHNEDTILRQVRVAQSKLQFVADDNLRSGMEVYLYDLSNRVKSAVRSTDTGRIPLSCDYIIEVENPAGASAVSGSSTTPTSAARAAAAAGDAAAAAATAGGRSDSAVGVFTAASSSAAPAGGDH